MALEKWACEQGKAITGMQENIQEIKDLLKQHKKREGSSEKSENSVNGGRRERKVIRDNSESDGGEEEV